MLNPIATFTRQRLLPVKTTPPAGEDAVVLAPTQSITRGAVLGQVTSTKKYKLCDPAGSDGSQVGKVIAQYDMQVDSNGGITFSATAGTLVGDVQQTYPTAPVYISGVFDPSELNVNGTPGLTSGIVGDLKGRISKGDLTSAGSEFIF